MTHDSSVASASDPPRPPWAVPAADGEVRAPSPAPEPGTRLPVREPRWGLPSAVIGLAVFVGLQLLVGVVAIVGWLLAGHGARPPGVAVATATLVVAYAGLLSWQYGVARAKGRGMVAEYRLRFRWYDLPLGVGGAVVAGVGLLLGTLAVSAATGTPPSSNVGTTVLNDVRAGPVLYVFLALVAFGAPFVEELHFRGMWWRALARRMRPVFTVLLTAALFAAVHLEPVRIVGLFAAGLVLGALRLLTDRLGPSVVAHTALNTFAAIQLLVVTLG